MFMSMVRVYSFKVVLERQLHSPQEVDLVAYYAFEKLKNLVSFVYRSKVNGVPIVSIHVQL